MPERSKETKELSVEYAERGQVTFEKSLTKNLGDYNSAKVTVGVTLPLNPTKEELKSVAATIRIADDIVTEELTKQIKELD